MALNICLLVATLLLKTLSIVEAQQPPKVPRVGYVASAGTATTDGSYTALREGLQDLGYTNGKNIVLEYPQRGRQG